MFKIKNNFLAVVILSIVGGLVAGVAGGIVTRVYLLKDSSFPYLNSDVDLGDLNASRPNLIIRDAKKVVVNQDVKVSETIASVQTSLVRVFKEITSAAASKNQAASSSPSFYRLTEPLLTGLMITSDGWAVAPLDSDALAAGNYIAITDDRRIYKVDKILGAPEAPRGLAFLHLAEATNLPVKKIISRSELSLGQSALVMDNLNQAQLTSLVAFDKTPEVLSSDSLNARLVLALNLGKDSPSAFVFNLAGDFLAIINNQQEVVPAFSYNPYWQNLLLPNAGGPPFLGINYLDLSLVQPLAINLNKGAWLYPAGNQPAVLPASPAQAAGLKSGDVITWVGNQELNAAVDLADVIAKYRPGDKITLTYWRAGQEHEAEVTLSPLPKK